MRRARAGAALRMVQRRPLRSSLAALGVAIALAALLIAVAIAERGKLRALAEIRAMGANVLTVSAEASRNRGGRARTGALVTTLTLADAREVERQVPGVARTAAEYRGDVPVKAGNLVRETTIAGMEPAYGALREAPMRSGRFFSDVEDAAAQRVAVLGGLVAEELFPGRDPVGEPLRLGGVWFRVIGVFGARGTGLDAFDEDEVIFVPLHTARRRLFQVDYVQRLFIRVAAGRDGGAVAGAIIALLRARHRVTGAEPPDFRVQDQERLIAVRETMVRQLGAFQLEVSGALLGAGTLGVFALQLLSVRERRSEIGTRRALGATRSMIFGQFLLEAGTVCVSGAAAGVALGAAGTALVHAPLSPVLAAAAFAGSCAAGLVAAAGPARTASALPPAVALRAQ
jgi:putative ABC transport system permease protein